MKRFLLAAGVGAALAIAAACTGSDPEPVAPLPDAAAPPRPGDDDGDGDDAAAPDGAVPSTDDPVDGGALAIDASVIPELDAGTWTPNDIDSGIVVFWVDGDKGIAHPAGDATDIVSRWTDTRPNGLHAAQANLGYRPAMSPALYNGHAAVRFTAKCNLLGVQDTSALQFSGGEFTIAVAATAHNTTPGYPGNFVSKVNDANPHEGFLLRMAASDGQLARGSVNVSLFVTSPVAPSDLLHRIVYRRTLPRVMDIRADGKGRAVTMPETTDVSAVGADMRIGAQRFSSDHLAASDCLDGDIAEIVVVDRAIRDEEVGLVEAYFKQKYGKDAL